MFRLRCDECGVENGENASFCHECGSELYNSKNGSSDGNIRKNRNLVLIAIVAVILFIAVIGYVGLKPTNSILTINNSSNGDDSNPNNQNNKPQVQGQRTVCTSCDGKGTLGICSECGGTGLITCTNCGGSGFINGIECTSCGGSGKIKCPGGQGPCNNGLRICGACDGDGYLDNGDPGPMDGGSIL